MKIAATTLTPRSSGTAQQLRCWVALYATARIDLREAAPLRRGRHALPAGARLTIHSSRRRFAARLNLDVRE